MGERISWLAVACLVAAGCAGNDPERAERMKKPAEDPPTTSQVATFGGGCFWCTEAVFQQMKGVTKVVSGYSGGHVKSPTYEQVCTGTTGHAEVVQVTFDPAVVSYPELLEGFSVP